MIQRWLLPALVGLGTATLAYQATLLATPFALMRVAEAKVGKGLSNNEFHFGPMTTAENQTIVRPSPDLSYSLCVFDLSKGPVLVRAEPIPGRYWSVSVFDARTDVAIVLSDRDTAGKPAMLAVTKPGQHAPAGYLPVQVEYPKGIVLLRILLADKADFPAVDALRRKSFCRSA